MKSMNEYCTLDIHNYAISKDGVRFTISRNLDNLCIAAFHTAIPYVVGFRRDAWYSWEKEKDAVIAYCPAGQAELEIRRLNHDTVQIKVLTTSGQCPKHQPGDTTTFNFQDESFEVIDSIFPVLSYILKYEAVQVTLYNPVLKCPITISMGSDDRESCKTKLQACDFARLLQESPSCVQVVGMKRSCKYHRRLRSYTSKELLPDNVCEFAYHAIYPTILSMLYKGKSGNKVTLSCPGIDNKVTFVIERSPKRTKLFLEIIEHLLRFLKYPQDIISERIKISITHQEGTCFKNIKEGTTFSFGDKTILCASSFDNLFGAIVNRINDIDSGKNLFQCTSRACRIQYRLS